MSAGTVHPREQQRETRLHGRRRGKSDPSHIPHVQLNQHTVHCTCKHQPQRVTAATPFRLSSHCSAGGRTRNGGQTSVSMSTPGSAARARDSLANRREGRSRKQAGTETRPDNGATPPLINVYMLSLPYTRRSAHTFLLILRNHHPPSYNLLGR